MAVMLLAMDYDNDMADLFLDDREECLLVQKETGLHSMVTEMDLERVINGAPWTFNNHLMVFYRLEKGEDTVKGSVRCEEAFEKKEEDCICIWKPYLR
ncbi:hypothetical protein J1N35_010455 [Gossypium stocksii]|uniref:DUF4283 domain-containing protein n=1 Tax=Gossypium stocksii TaxID=47602 RepID=A0A9D3W112_9ROSI|nr:hypothetical protein J1N35_010455 [Gossypium stocksii]